MRTELPTHVCLLGFGEVGRTLANDLGRRPGLRLSSFDLAFADPGSRPSRDVAASRAAPVGTARAAAAGAGLLISAVTAAQDLPAAESVAAALPPGGWFLDLNSVSPATRRRVAALVEASGGRYVEAAVMAPIGPRGIATPMLLGGPHAEAFGPVAEGLGFTGARVFAGEVGRAAATKMCRSVVVKGLEALLTEALLAARRYGVEAEVLASLADLRIDGDWPVQARDLLSRSLRHGSRRAEEMREVAATVADAGVEPWMSEACARRQDRAAGYACPADEPELGRMLDRILAGSYSRAGS